VVSATHLNVDGLEVNGGDSTRSACWGLSSFCYASERLVLPPRPSDLRATQDGHV
jgi:hypothetical protein